MWRCMLGLFSGLVVVSLIFAQPPLPKSQDEPEAKKSGTASEAQRPTDRPPAGRGFLQPPPGRAGFPERRPPDADRPAAPARQPAERPSLALPRPSAPLPAAGEVGKQLLLDVLLAETGEALVQPTAAELLAMERAGKLKGNARVRLLLMENQQAFTQFGELATRVTGRATTGLNVVPIYSSMNVGTVVQATARLEDDGTIVMQIYVEKSTLEKSSLPPEQREPENMTRMLVQTTVRAKPGEQLVLTGGPGNGSDATWQSWVVMSCQVFQGGERESEGGITNDAKR